MKRMSLNLDQDLLQEAMREFKTETPSATVQYALTEFVRWKKHERRLELRLAREDARLRAKRKIKKKNPS
jgi:Arc/MetJ family transcription regulator